MPASRDPVPSSPRSRVRRFIGRTRCATTAASARAREQPEPFGHERSGGVALGQPRHTYARRRQANFFLLRDAELFFGTFFPALRGLGESDRDRLLLARDLRGFAIQCGSRALDCYDEARRQCPDDEYVVLGFKSGAEIATLTSAGSGREATVRHEFLVSADADIDGSAVARVRGVAASS
jgi:hypothetical protein